MTKLKYEEQAFTKDQFEISVGNLVKILVLLIVKKLSVGLHLQNSLANI